MKKRGIPCQTNVNECVCLFWTKCKKNPSDNGGSGSSGQIHLKFGTNIPDITPIYIVWQASHRLLSGGTAGSVRLVLGDGS